MDEPQKKPGVLSWVALFLAMFVLYALSENLIIWLTSKGLALEWMRLLHVPLWWIRNLDSR